jgi:PAS domain S-box-containing protein
MITLGKQSASGASLAAGASCERRPHAHSIQFYENDDFLLDGLSGFIGAALLAGDSAMVIATKAHREGLDRRLTSRGVNLTHAIQESRYLAFDAAETKSKFIVDGKIDEDRFSRLVDSMIKQIGGAEQLEHHPVAIFGEMVNLLWAEGKSDVAIELEHRWSALARTYAFHVHCAYPIHFFSQEKNSVLLHTLCSEHTLVVPNEDFMALASDDEERRGSVLFLQQKAQALESELLARKQAEQSRHKSEERLRLAQQVAGIGIFEWDIETNVSLWTPELEVMHGLPRGGFTGTREAWEELLHPDDRSEVLKLLAASFDTEAPVQAEWRVVWPDGSVHWLAGKWQVIRDQSGKPLRMTGASIDITDRKRAEQVSLQLAAIVQSADDAIVGKDLNGVVTSWNRAAEDIFGYQAEEIVGRSILLIIPPELQDQEPRILAKIMAGEHIEHFETVRLRKDGERLNVALTMSPVRNQTGKIIGVAKIVRNITKQKKLEENLQTTEKLAAVGRLAATIAHEINNPLAAVTNLIYLARQHPELADQVRNYLQRADTELRRISHMTKQTLGFYRDNSQPVEFGVAQAIEDVLTIYESRFQHKALQIEKRIQPGLMVCTTQGEFKQILSNLIANAIDASKHGDRIRICARATRHVQSGRDGIRVTVADDGAGISTENKQKAFTPFFTTKREVGTGLGLWVTKDMIEKKGGSIRLRSQTQTKSGTTLRFFIPTQLPPHHAG